MKAEFRSKCSTCGESIEPGDDITQDEGDWVHCICAAEHVGPRRPTKFTVSDLDWSD